MKIAVLTSGGDSAGMNAVVRAVVKAGILKYVLLPSFVYSQAREWGGSAFKSTHQQRV
jgi:6-phosphofructokinase